MSWLARLKNGTNAGGDPREPRKLGFLGFLGTPSAPFQKSEGLGAANDPAALDPERWGWPNSPAMNSGELDTFAARVERFTGKGLGVDDAEALADRLVTRDRQADGRRLCLECAHLRGVGRWRCTNSGPAEVAGQGLAAELAMTLQHCPGFRA